MRFRAAVTKAIEYRSKQEICMDEKVTKLRLDILNGPSHIFGEHKNCLKSSYFCKEKQTNENTLFADIKLTRTSTL